MKKILLFVVGLVAFGAYAQNDLSITLEEPQANATLGPGMAFDFQVTITNVGSTDVTTSDTVVWAPRINGNFLTTTQGGQTVTLIFFQTGKLVAGGGTGIIQDTVSFSGLNINGASSGQIDFCGWVNGLGPNWRNITEDDENNNEHCNTVNYDSTGGGSVGIYDNVLSTQTVNILDGSYYTDGVYKVRVYNMFSQEAKLTFVDLTGRVIRTESLNGNGGRVNQDITLDGIQSGILLAVLEVDGRIINTNKIFIE